jgi:hypothetical protein
MAAEARSWRRRLVVLIAASLLLNLGVAVPRRPGSASGVRPAGDTTYGWKNETLVWNTGWWQLRAQHDDSVLGNPYGAGV